MKDLDSFPSLATRTLLAAALACLSAVSALADGLPPVLVSRETTYITAPLTPDGLPDYGTYLNQRGDAGIALADNAAPPVLEIVGIEIDAGTRRRLGLPGRERSGPRLVRSPVGGDRRRFVAEMSRAKGGPWTPADAPLVAAWLADNEKALDAVALAVTRRGYWWPRWEPGLATGPVPSIIGLREAADGLAWRGAMRVAAGRGPEAVDDLVAALRLGCLVARGGSLLDGLVGSAARGVVAETIVAVAAHLRPPDVERLLTGMDGLPEIPPLEWSLEAERVLQLGLALELRRLGAARGPRAWRPYVEIEHLREAPAGIYDVDPSTVDWNELLRLVNRTYDGDTEARGTGATAVLREAVGVFNAAGSRTALERTAAEVARARSALRRAHSR